MTGREDNAQDSQIFGMALSDKSCEKCNAQINLEVVFSISVVYILKNYHANHSSIA